MNIAIVDDNERDQTCLEQMLRRYAVMNQLEYHVDLFPSGEALLGTYQPFQYTTIFLDVFMDGLSGIETAERIREVDEDSILVFLTSSEKHRPEAFSVFATAYLSKPCNEEQLFRLMDHILRRRTETDQRFTFSFDRREYSLRYADIVSIETDGNYINIKEKNGACFRARMTFTQAQGQVDSRFLILMKGILVNMDCIERISDTRCIMLNGDTFPLRMKNAKELEQKWLNYKFTSIRNATASLGAKTEC